MIPICPWDVRFAKIAIIYFRPRIEELEKYIAEDGEHNKLWTIGSYLQETEHVSLSLGK